MSTYNLRGSRSANTNSGGGASETATKFFPAPSPSNANNAHSKSFEIYVDDASRVFPFSSPNGLKFVGMMNKSAVFDTSINKLKREFRCNTCIHNAGILMRLVGENSGYFCQTPCHNKTKHQKIIGENLRGYYHSLKNAEIDHDDEWSIVIVPHTSYTSSEGCPTHALMKTYTKTTKVTDKTSQYYRQQFNHYWFNGSRSDASFNDKIIHYQFLLKKYTTLYIALLNKFNGNDFNAIAESCDFLISDILPEAPYAMSLAHGINWFKRLISQFKNGTRYYNFWRLSTVAKMKVIGISILSEQFKLDDVGDDGDLCITGYHQFNGNILKLLQMRKNKSQMISFLKNMFKPSNYMRSTKAPSEGQIKMAATGLGNYHVTILTKDRMLSLVPDVVELSGVNPNTVQAYVNSSGGGGGGGDCGGGGDGGAFSAMNSLLAKSRKTPNPKSKYDFAGRVNGRDSFRTPCSITELVDLVKSGQIWRIRINTSSKQLVYLGEFIGGNVGKMLVTDSTWGWTYTDDVKVYTTKTISHIVPIINKGGFTNWLFIFSKADSYVKGLTAPIRWKGILKKSYITKYGTAFEAIGREKSMNVRYPSYQYDLSIGVGVTAKNATALTNPMSLYINDSLSPITISTI